MARSSTCSPDTIPSGPLPKPMTTVGPSRIEHDADRSPYRRYRTRGHCLHHQPPPAARHHRRKERKKERKRKENKKYKRKWQKKRIQNKRKEKERNKDPYDCSPDLYMVIANSITHRPKTRLEALPLAFPILTGVTLASREHNISSQGALVQVR